MLWKFMKQMLQANDKVYIYIFMRNIRTVCTLTRYSYLLLLFCVQGAWSSL